MRSRAAARRGSRTEYFIYGGTPPYRVTATFPTAVTIVNPTVNTSGGSFQAITNGACVDPLTFSIFDASGRQTTATLSNVEGTADAPVVTPAALAVAPATPPADPACTGKTFNFIVFGGTPPYNVKPASPGTTTTPSLAASGDTAKVSGYTTGSGANTVLFLDSSVPQKTITATITCS